MGMRESSSTRAFNAQPAPIHSRKPRPPPQLSMPSKRCSLKAQRVSQQGIELHGSRLHDCNESQAGRYRGFAPTPVDVTFEGREKSDFESRDNLLKNQAEYLGDLGCRFVFSQVMSEVSCSKDLLCKVEALRLLATKKHSPNDRRPPTSTRRRSPLRNLRVKPEPAPTESIPTPSPAEDLPSPEIRSPEPRNPLPARLRARRHPSNASRPPPRHVQPISQVAQRSAHPPAHRCRSKAAG